VSRARAARGLETSGPLGLVPRPLVRPPAIGVALATAAYVAVFLSITNVVGGSARLAAALLLALVAGVVLARLLALRSAVALSVALLAAGLTGYYLAVPESQRELFTVSRVLLDTVSMLTGLSVLRLTAADVWALGVAPVPTFLAWYLAARGRYVGGALVAGGALSFFVLTGDAGLAATLLGVAGVALAVGLETVSVPAGTDAHLGTLAAVLAAMVVLAATLSVVPGGAAQPWNADRGSPAIESSIVGTKDSVRVVGSVQLSPEKRFTVESTQGARWHTASYDRYTGDGWVRTGEASPYSGPLEDPPGTTVTVEQTVTAETDLDALPAAWKATSLSGPPGRSAQVSEQGGIQPGTTVLEGDTYTVESQVVQAPPDQLRDAPEEYPDDVEERYTQLPEDTPDRVGELTDEVAASADADNPYDTAVAIERYLRQSKDYSLTVQRPQGDIADSFLFEMDAGYCVYFATTMVAMLRTQGIPAKFVTGYSEGERVGQDEWVVRGQDAHAWVMVYFPEHGWVEFDPTPSAEREAARDARLVEAARNDEVEVEADAVQATPDVDADSNETETNGSAGGETPAPVGPDNPEVGDLDPGPSGIGGPAETETTIGDIDADAVAGEEDGGPAGPLPDRERIGYALVLLFGLVAGAHHTGATDRAYRAAWLRIQRRRDPVTDAQRAFARLEYLLSRRHRERRPGETPRDYLSALELRDVDERVHRVGETYERALYAGDVTREEADEAVRTVTRLALEATPLVGRLFR